MRGKHGEDGYVSDLSEASYDKDDNTNTANIKITRSDNRKDDLVTVFASNDIAKLVQDTKAKESENTVANEEDSGNINVIRSDGDTHDIIKVFKANSDEVGDTMKLRRAHSAGSGGLAIQGRKSKSPNVSFTNLFKDLHIRSKSPPNSDPSSSSKPLPRGYYPSSVRIVHMSDTHNLLSKDDKHSFLPVGDILVHTGDFSNEGKEAEYNQFNMWLSSVAHIYHYRVVCPGSRDVRILGNDWDEIKKRLPNATHVLCHNEATILGLRFYGCPWAWGHKCNYTVRKWAPRSTSGRFEDIPEGIHVLISHGPANGRLDLIQSQDPDSKADSHWGSGELLDALKRARPGLHLHGHVKDSRGFIPGGHLPMSVNSAMSDNSLTVLYAVPHVIKAEQISPDRGGQQGVNWTFKIDSLEP